MALMRIRLSQIKAQDAALVSFEEQVNGMGIPHYQIVTASAGQTAFEVSKAYQVGTGQLNVYLNGMKVQPTSSPLLSDGDYREVSDSEIQFVYALAADDLVEIRMEGKGQGISMVVDHYHSYKEEPSGAIDGTNKVFTLSKAPRAYTENIYVNGILMRPGTNNDYTISTNVITFKDAPVVGSIILVNYDTLYTTT